jgi:hypothetical protein
MMQAAIRRAEFRSACNQTHVSYVSKGGNTHG